jgi:threonine dehydrogenase-like Zn-dependent dehydrogenase
VSQAPVPLALHELFAEPGRVEIRQVELPEVGPDDVGVRTAYSGVSQGTERWLPATA